MSNGCCHSNSQNPLGSSGTHTHTERKWQVASRHRVELSGVIQVSAQQGVGFSRPCRSSTVMVAPLKPGYGGGGMHRIKHYPLYEVGAYSGVLSSQPPTLLFRILVCLLYVSCASALLKLGKQSLLLELVIWPDVTSPERWPRRLHPSAVHSLHLQYRIYRKMNCRW